MVILWLWLIIGVVFILLASRMINNRKNYIQQKFAKSKKNAKKLEPINWTLNNENYLIDDSGVHLSGRVEKPFFGWNEFQAYYSERKSEEEEIMVDEELNRKEVSETVKKIRNVENEDIFLVGPEKYLFFTSKIKLTVRS